MQKIYPFKFLDSYQKKDKDFFFGRNEEIESLYQMIFETKILLVFGTSGTGKTSLIQCGLANKFQTYDWLELYIRRGSNIIASLDKTLCQESDEVFTYVEQKEPVINNLSAKIKAVYKASFRPIYLIFDQFEELYILGSKKEQQNFIQTVKEILTIQQPVKIIISIREEYLGYLYEFEKAVPELLRKKLRVEPMNLEKVKTVITNIGSSPQSNVHLASGEEDRIAERIFEKIRGDEKILSIQLPYLQVFLDRLYMKKSNDQTQKSEATISLSDVESTGTFGDVLGEFLDDQVKSIATDLKLKPEQIRELLTPFVSIDGTKVPLSAIKLKEGFPDQSASIINSVLDSFVKSRILRFTEKDELYEIAHDSLAKKVNATRSEEEIAIEQAKSVIKNQLIGDYFTQKQLLKIDPCLDKLKLQSKISPEEIEWISKSRSHILEEQKIKEDQERKLSEAKATKKRLRVVGSLLGVAAIAIIVAIIFWFVAKEQEKIATTEKGNALRSLETLKITLDSNFRLYSELPGVPEKAEDLEEYRKSMTDFTKRFENLNGITLNKIKKEKEVNKNENVTNLETKIEPGKKYEGGIIVLVYLSDNKGLIAAEKDLEGVLTWQEAINECARLDSTEGINGYKGWRLPKQFEMYQMYLKRKEIPSLNLTGKDYWSFESSQYKALHVNFLQGGYKGNNSKNAKYSVRLVRDF